MIDTQIQRDPITHIPRGVADYFWQEAQTRRAVEQVILETFRRWGYGDVIPPMFEYADVLEQRANVGLRAAMYRFLDRDGSTLTLRPDMTIAVARLVGTRLHDWPMPQRFCYAGSVFRYLEPQAGRQREFLQTGIELFGVSTPAADAEVLALTAQALRAAGVHDFQLVLGQIRYFEGLLEDLKLKPTDQAALTAAIDSNSAAALDDFLRDVPLRTQQRRTIEELPLLSGAATDAILAQADRHCLNYAMHAALDNLRAICGQLEHYDLADALFLDLTEINNLGYYTGLTFEALAPGLGFPIASGGRYDNLVGSFGPDQPAVGAALGLDRILLARRAGQDGVASPHPQPPHALVSCGDDKACVQLVQRWRARGLRIATDIQGRTPAALWTSAQQVGIPYLFVWDAPCFTVFGAAPANPAGVQWSREEADRFMQEVAP